MPRQKQTTTRNSSRRRGAPKLSKAQMEKRFRKQPSYREGDIIIGFPDERQKMLVLDIVDKLTYYQYKLLVLNTGEFTAATAWYMEECLIQYGKGTLPPPIA